ncbi:hypothetical protein D9M73_252410 [compost metagenome]
MPFISRFWAMVTVRFSLIDCFASSTTIAVISLVTEAIDLIWSALREYSTWLVCRSTSMALREDRRSCAGSRCAVVAGC